MAHLTRLGVAFILAGLAVSSAVATAGQDNPRDQGMAGSLQRPADPAIEEAARQAWEWLLAREDDYLVEQAVAAGCDERNIAVRVRTVDAGGFGARWLLSAGVAGE